MLTLAVDAPRSVLATRVSILRVFLVEARMECLRLARAPSFAVPIILFPVMFYALFGLVLGGHGHSPDSQEARHLLAAYVAFGAIAPGLFGVGITLALDRDRGLLRLTRALPMPPGVYLAAKLVAAVIFASIVSVTLMLLAATAGKVVLELVQWAGLLILGMLGVIPFCGLGLMVGAFVKGQAAPAVLNLIYVPMSFLAGLWVPLSALPHVLAQWAPVWPAYHLAKLAGYVVGEGGIGWPVGLLTERLARESPVGTGWPMGLPGFLLHVLDLVGMSVLFFAVARRGLRKVS